MAELHITDIDERVLTRLRERAQQDNVELEEIVRHLLEEAAEEEHTRVTKKGGTLRMPPRDRSFQAFQPITTSGISASALLIRDRRS